MKTCSVIVPVFNEEQTIVEALNRLMAVSNSYSLEVIVVESKSLDNTRKLLLEFARINPIILILQS
jgi:glycosyltransferase involved in cell wall biosynthesis